MPVEIKTLSRKDVDQYVNLLRLGFGEELQQRGTNIARIGRMARVMSSFGGLPLRLIKATTGRGLYTLVAKDGSRVVGVLTVIEGREPILIGAYIIEEYRRQGVALGLIREALRRLKKHGYSRVRGSVYNHTAQLLVERAGFAPYDHMDLYQCSLPKRTSVPDSVFVQRTRKVDLPRYPYDLGPLNLFTGVHIRCISIHSGDEETMEGMLIALPHQTVGEIQVRIIVPGREETFSALLKAGYEWFSHLGRSSISVPLHDGTASLATILTKEGFVKRHSWVQMTCDL